MGFLKEQFTNPTVFAAVVAGVFGIIIGLTTGSGGGDTVINNNFGHLVPKVIGESQPSITESQPSITESQASHLNFPESPNWNKIPVEFLGLEFHYTTNNVASIARTEWMKQINGIFLINPSNAQIREASYKRYFNVRQVNDRAFHFKDEFNGNSIKSLSGSITKNGKLYEVAGFEVYRSNETINVWGPELEKQEPLKIAFNASRDPDDYNQWGIYLRFFPDLSMHAESIDTIISTYNKTKHTTWGSLENDLVSNSQLFKQFKNALTISVNDTPMSNIELDYIAGVKCIITDNSIFKHGVNTLTIERNPNYKGYILLSRVHILLNRKEVSLL